MTRHLRLLTAVLIASCTRSHPPAPADADANWREGRLPQTVMEGEPRRGGTLVVRIDQEPPSLDPMTDSSLAITWMLERKIFESMAALDASKHPDYPLKPMLATSWEVSPDQLTFSFHLRRDVLWQDGAPFSGKDVVATVKKILDPSVRSLHLRNNFVDLTQISTAPGDDFTVVARYRKPYFLALRALATLPHLSGASARAVGRHAARADPPGSGWHRTSALRGVEERRPHLFHAQRKVLGA